MKIIKRVEIGDRIIGIMKCKACQSEMELQVKDCGVATHTDYGGDSENYVYVYCGVCNEYQEPKGCNVTYSEVKRYVDQETAKRNLLTAAFGLGTAPSTT